MHFSLGKTRWIVTLAAATAIGGCTCRKTSEPVRRDDDAAPISDAKSPLEPDRDRFVVIGADVVDLVQHKVVFTAKEKPTRFAVDAGGAYVWNGHRLEAFDLPEGRARWAYEDASPSEVRAPILVDDRRVYVAWDDRVYTFDRATGERAELVDIPGKHVVSNAALYDGAYVLSLYGTSAVFVDLADRKTHMESVPPGAETIAFMKEAVLGVYLDTTSTVALGVHAWSPRGAVLFDRSVGASPGSRPPMGFVREIPGYFLLSAHEPGTHSVILSQRDGSIAFEAARPISDATVDATRAPEWIVAPSKAGTVEGIDAKTSAVRWSVAFDCYEDTVVVASNERALFLAAYTYGTGSGCLVAVDRSTGATLWSAHLDDAKVPHSEYWNEITLRMHGGDLVVVGREAGAEYVEALDPKTGDKRFDHLVRF